METNDSGRRIFVNDENCPIRNIIAHFGDKWSMLVLFAIVDGPDRFNSIRNRIQGISQRMLTQTLRGLEKDGYVIRTVYPEVPVRVEYELSEMGKELVKHLYAVVSWAETNKSAIHKSRKAFANQ
jgi:DNA-binding HxlR family transcriptional regulator